MTFAYAEKKEQANLYRHPPSHSQSPLNKGKNTQVTIGDLHGNAMKLMYVLVHENLLTLPGNNNSTRELSYGILASIYQLSVEDLADKEMDKNRDPIFQRFKQVLSTIKSRDDTDRIINTCSTKLDIFKHILELAQINKGATLRLIGDDLADRGSNDYFTLKILEKLGKNNVPFEVLLSDHGNEFLSVYDKGLKTFETNLGFSETVITGEITRQIDHRIAQAKSEELPNPQLKIFSNADGLKRIDPNTYKKLSQEARYNMAAVGNIQDNSLHNMGLLINKGLVSRSEVQTIVDTYYKPNLKLLSYSLNEKKDSITFFSHAPIGLKTISALAKELSVEFKDETREQLAKTIDLINQRFSRYVKKNGGVNLLSKYDKVTKPTDATLDFPVVRAMWRRINGSHSQNDQDDPLIESQKGYHMQYVHGHDGNGEVLDKYQTFVKNIDDPLGKALLEIYNQGEYIIDVRQEIQLPSATLDAKKVAELDAKIEIAAKHHMNFREAILNAINIFNEKMTESPAWNAAVKKTEDQRTPEEKKMREEAKDLFKKTFIINVAKLHNTQDIDLPLSQAIQEFKTITAPLDNKINEKKQKEEPKSQSSTTLISKTLTPGMDPLMALQKFLTTIGMTHLDKIKGHLNTEQIRDFKREILTLVSTIILTLGANPKDLNLNEKMKILNDFKTALKDITSEPKLDNKLTPVAVKANMDIAKEITNTDKQPTPIPGKKSGML